MRKIKTVLRRIVGWLFLLSLLLLSSRQHAVSQVDPAQEFYQLITQARLEAGLPPLARSALLTQASQRHADDMAANGFIGQVGSDDSTYQQRIREANYHAWKDGLLVNESIWAGLGSASNALGWFKEQPEHWDMFVDPRYRELGVGYARDKQGINYFVLDFGSRPGVLPIFINDGAETAAAPQVAVRLTNEEAMPAGDGNRIGEAIEVRLSSTLDFSDATPQPWEELVPWLLPDNTPGDYAVYVEFRDGAERTTVSEGTIRLTSAGETAPATPAPAEATVLAATPLPTSTPTGGVAPLTPVPTTDIELPVSTPFPAPTAQPTESVPTCTPLPTWTPLPTVTAANAEQSRDWPLLAVLMLQGLAILLGLGLFLRR
ncbi:MAG: CAP domain-containing protein [Chloroflexota bacterium]|nr:CAP domain-containing protein [Chloroflexota bacterium]